MEKKVITLEQGLVAMVEKLIAWGYSENEIINLVQRVFKGERKT